MADLIERNAAIRMLSDYAETQQDLDYYRDMLMNIPAVNCWISVNDALPEIGQNVLIYAVEKEKCYESKITITKRTDVIWFGHEVKTEPYWKDPWQYFHSDYEITHWMPLPEPPKE